jgi:hypothetical protein
MKWFIIIIIMIAIIQIARTNVLYTFIDDYDVRKSLEEQGRFFIPSPKANELLYKENSM